jgi:fimbrial chaperone protein
MNIKSTSLSLLVAGSALLCTAFSAQAAGGVALGSTRLIYPEGTKEVSISLSNSSDKNSFLVQSWIAGADGKKKTDYVLTPPLFVSKPKSENTLRVMYAGPALPTDRESVFYLHSRAIPSLDPKSAKGGNVLQIAIESVIKVFWRPKGLNTTEQAAEKTITCNQSGSTLTLNNPSPYYISLVSLNVGNTKLPNTMVPPKGSQTVKVNGGHGAVTYKAINDYGSESEKMTCASSH